MALSTFAELKTAIKGVLERPNIADSTIETWIAMAEADFDRTLKHYEMETTTTLNVTSENTALPTDYLQAKRVYIAGTTKALKVVRSSKLQDMLERRGYAAGEPTHYAIIGTSIAFYPAPASATVSMLYLQKIPRLSDSNTSNWLLEMGPDAYLYGALLHSAPYENDDARMATWGMLLQRAKDALDMQSDMAKFAADNVAMV